MSECCGGEDVLIYPCSGASDVGELSDQAARVLSRERIGSMACLAGVGANFPGFVGSAKKAAAVITIDGCQIACAKSLMKNNGVNAQSFILTEMGFKKGLTKIDESNVDKLVLAIKAKFPAKANSKGNCSCNCDFSQNGGKPC